MEELATPVFVARQPIFDKNLKIWGYELLFREAESAKEANVTDGEYATSKVILYGFPLAQKGVKNNVKFLINFTEESLLKEIPFLLPKDRVIVEVLETVSLNTKIAKLCIKLKKSGYMLALDDFTGEIENKKFFYIFDIIKIDLPNFKDDIKNTVKELKRYKCKVLAEKVENRKEFEFTKEAGFDLFQGFFFSKPQIVSGRTINPTQLSKIKLLNILSQKEDLTPEKLAEVIKSDVSLSYNLLKFINSASFSFLRKIESIKDAINYLGMQNVIKWCMILLLTHLNPSSVGKELVRLSVQRAYFLENLYKYVKVPVSQDSFFLLGMFSKLDAILNLPMEEALKDIKIDPKVKDALVKGNELTTYLFLLENYEKGNWETVDKMTSELGISSEKLLESHLKALEFLSKFYYEF